MEKKKTGVLLSILGIIGIILITSGATYAFFNYAKSGTTENVVTTGSITFLYTEVSGVGNGISIIDAYPTSDSQGRVQTGEGKVFDFKVTSTTMENTSIPYEVTARKKSTSTLEEDAIKLYLTKVEGDVEEEVLLENYSDLTQTSKISTDKYVEKTIYKGEVTAGSVNYEQAFRLRMWIDESIDFSPIKDSEGNDTYLYNDKTFTVTVNVYANAKVVTDEEVVYSKNTKISSLSIDGTELTSVLNQEYDYTTTLPNGTSTTTINVETENPNATVKVEKIDSLAYSSNIRRLSGAKVVELTTGNNDFKIIVTSENEEVTEEYIVRITVEKESINTLDSLSLSSCVLSPVFTSGNTSYSCTVENSVTSTTISATTTSSLATIKGLEEKNLDVGKNTITLTVTAEDGSKKVYTIVVTRLYAEYLIGDSVTATDGSKWHVLEASSSESDTVVLLSDYNLNSDGTYNTECGRNINNNVYCSVMAFDPDYTHAYNESDSNNIGYFIKNTYKPLITASLPNTTNVTLPTIQQLLSVEGLNYVEHYNSEFSGFTTSWLITTNYYLLDSNDISRHDFLTSGGLFSSFLGDSVELISGARPVITTPKSNLISE